MHGVMITELINKFQLKNITPDIDTEKIVLTHPEVNRPALQLAGFFDHFDNSRIQIIGRIEHTYMRRQTPETRMEIFDKLFRFEIPCIVF